MKELLESSFFIVLNLFLIKPLDKYIYFFILLIKISTILTCYVLKNKKNVDKIKIKSYYQVNEHEYNFKFKIEILKTVFS